MSYSPMELAEAFLKTGEIEDALDALNQELEQNPSHDYARRLRIQVLLRLSSDENLAKAVDDFQKLASANADDFQRLSVLEERLGRLEAAIEAIQKARDLAPNDERLSERHLDLLLSQKSYEMALDLVRQQERNWRWLEREGDILAQMGDDTMATARYGLVLAQLDDYEGVLRPDYIDALKARVILARAHAYRRLGQLDIAADLYESAQSKLPNDPSISFNLGLLEAMKGETEKAIQICKAALEQASSSLKQEMQHSLESDERFSGLKETLLKSS